MRAGPAGRGKPQDIRSEAAALVDTLGEQAICHANYQALKARQRGDRPAADRWLWVAGVTRELLRSDPVGEA